MKILLRKYFNSAVKEVIEVDVLPRDKERIELDGRTFEVGQVIIFGKGKNWDGISACLLVEGPVGEVTNED